MPTSRPSGLAPGAYLGVGAPTPPNLFRLERDPGPEMWNVVLGDLALNYLNGNLWYNIQNIENNAIWILISSGGPGGTLNTITGDVGGAVPGDAGGNINILNSPTQGFTLTGTPINNTLTLTYDYLNLPDTTALNNGTIQFNGVSYFSNFSSVGGPAANLFVGRAARFATVTGRGNNGFGDFVFQDLTSGESNTAMGVSALANVTTGSHNVGLGVFAGLSLTTGSSNTFVGDTAHSTATGSNNIIIGANAGNSQGAATSNCTLIGSPGVGGNNYSDLLAVNVGATRIMHNFPGSLAVNGSNFFIGELAGNYTLTNTNNYSIGRDSLQSLTTGPHNIGMGNGALHFVTTGDGNIGIGHAAGWDVAGMTGLTTGIRNIMIGYTAGSAYTSNESNNILIGSIGVVGEDDTITIGQFEAGEDPQTRCFIQGIRGITTGVADAIPVLIDSLGQLGTTSSSLRTKENIEDMGDISSDVLKLRPVTFNYKQDPSKRTAFGLIAEEVYELIPELVAHNKDGEIETVLYHQLPALLLNEIKKLNARIEQLEQRIK